MASSPQTLSLFKRYLLIAGVALTLAGYFAPWVNHAAAGLAILGLDLGEYVKFLVPVRDGSIWVWREGFYLPLFTVSLALSLYAFRPEVAWQLWLRVLALATAIVAALNMLPPAWTPALLRTPEFLMQTVWIIVALLAVAISSLLALLPRWFAQAVVVAGAVASLLLCVSMFLTVLPAIEALYNHAISPAWGLWVMCTGLVTLAAGVLTATRPEIAAAEVGKITDESPYTPIT